MGQILLCVVVTLELTNVVVDPHRLWNPGCASASLFVYFVTYFYHRHHRHHNHRSSPTVTTQTKCNRPGQLTAAALTLRVIAVQAKKNIRSSFAAHLCLYACVRRFCRNIHQSGGECDVWRGMRDASGVARSCGNCYAMLVISAPRRGVCCCMYLDVHELLHDSVIGVRCNGVACWRWWTCYLAGKSCDWLIATVTSELRWWWWWRWWCEQLAAAAAAYCTCVCVCVFVDWW